MEKVKLCNGCGEEKPLTKEFWHISKDKKDGFCSRCKDCKHKYKKQYYQEHKEYYNENNKKNRINNKEYHSRYFKQYQKENKFKVRRWWNKSRSKKYKIQVTLTENQWEKIKKDFNYRCAYCGKETDLQQEHFIPLSKGGAYASDNIIPACASCNSSKRAKNFSNWYPTYKYYSAERERFILDYINFNKEYSKQLALNL